MHEPEENSRIPLIRSPEKGQDEMRRRERRSLGISQIPLGTFPNRDIEKVLPIKKNKILILCAIHLQWVPSHVSIAGNEIANALAKDGADQPTINSTPLTYSELHSTYINNKQATVPPAHHCRQGGVVSLSLARPNQGKPTPKVEGSTPAQIPRVCLAWVLSAKLNPSANSHRHSTGTFFWEENWTSKLIVAIGIANMLPRLKVIPVPGKCTRSVKVKNINTPLEEKT
ncbi:RNase H domain-containing protein [Trichonephila clavipes]|nr:RNase H domain-containing protein [Trichonephila clavipes]